MHQKDEQPRTEPASSPGLADLDGPCRAFLFSLRKDGTPTCHPMVAMVTDGNITFNTYRASVKTQNLLRSPDSVSALILNDWQGKPGAARLVQGRIRAVHDPAEFMPSVDGERRAASGPLGEVSEERIRKARDRVASAKRIILELKPLPEDEET